ncbi:hypothetical protein L1267_21795 [Pseudoalteromonas sp. OFAV1]|uniref:hypothetical protein n=1 Tax=Pseudoalteromonas sp. OFAV1 TaxID=2908892 RepID=UPI001F323DF0|nr:hypothetical protein [Pseudoalteromonas sp. OFAV1]MCF2903010.1 hypothetical protein [Pseudoalteromonas sp. OFAV1]
MKLMFSLKIQIALVLLLSVVLSASLQWAVKRELTSEFSRVNNDFEYALYNPVSGVLSIQGLELIDKSGVLIANVKLVEIGLSVTDLIKLFVTSDNLENLIQDLQSYKFEKARLFLPSSIIDAYPLDLPFNKNGIIEFDAESSIEHLQEGKRSIVSSLEIENLVKISFEAVFKADELMREFEVYEFTYKISSKKLTENLVAINNYYKFSLDGSNDWFVEMLGSILPLGSREEPNDFKLLLEVIETAIANNQQFYVSVTSYKDMDQNDLRELINAGSIYTNDNAWLIIKERFGIEINSGLRVE